MKHNSNCETVLKMRVRTKLLPRAMMCILLVAKLAKVMLGYMWVQGVAQNGRINLVLSNSSPYPCALSSLLDVVVGVVGVGSTP